jgi:hypothetical protein
MHLTDEATVGQVLHARFVAGDPVASTEIFERYQAYLVRRLELFRTRKNLYSVDDMTIEAAAMEALGNYLIGSDAFDPSKGKTLAGFLLMAAEGDLLNLLRKHRPPDGVHLVELEDADRNNQTDGDGGFADDLADQMELDEWRKQARAAMETDEERIIFELMLAGERSNRVYAAALGWPDPENPTHAKQANKLKERVSKRLKRRFSMRVADD